MGCKSPEDECDLSLPALPPVNWSIRAGLMLRPVAMGAELTIFSAVVIQLP